VFWRADKHGTGKGDYQPDIPDLDVQPSRKNDRAVLETWPCTEAHYWLQQILIKSD